MHLSACGAAACFKDFWAGKTDAVNWNRGGYRRGPCSPFRPCVSTTWSEAIMTKSDHHKPTNFVGLYFIDEERYETGQVIAQISDGYYLAQFDCIEKGAPPPRLEVLSSVEFNKLCDSCGSRHWRFFADVESRKSWMVWLNRPDPANDKMGKVVHLKPKPEQPA
jgi:hypothetical protein